jgi:hypothetical protein
VANLNLAVANVALPDSQQLDYPPS